MTVNLRPLAEVTHEAIDVLCREIGVVDTLRFLGQFTTGSGNYTEERDRLFEGSRWTISLPRPGSFPHRNQPPIELLTTG